MTPTESPIPLSRPWFGDEELARIKSALAGPVAGDGPFGRAVERRLAEMWGVPRVLLTSSCTHALELALLAWGIGPGDEVICPSFTFVSTANAVLRVGARPVFADIEGRTFGLDAAGLEPLLTPRTRALLPVHYAGVAPDMDEILDLARRRSLRVIEDAAQGFGGRYRERPVGALGDAGCFSFHETKNISCGEGGALAFRDAGAAARAEIIREKGTNRSAFFRGEVDKYTWVMEGSSYLLSDVLAAILDAQLDRAAAIAERRSGLVARYRAQLADWAASHDVGLPPTYPDRQGTDHIYYLMMPSGEQRDRALSYLRSRGVMASFHYVPLHSSPMGRTLHDGRALPVTDRVAACLVRLPLHPGLSDADVERVVEAVRRSVAS